MKKSKGEKAIEDVAKSNGISVAEARKEIELAIDMAMANPDPTAKAFWAVYIKNGKKPTPEEFIVYMAKRVESKKHPQKITWLH
ncbi:hypothetical protein LJB90_00560 [Eubacteriales bacterium OttesenSCG-928-G02]|nr:hypothetical protein [Eubacteriales bacterium OttesenSCG-928-G02]